MSKYILRKRTQGFIVISGNVINALKKKLPVLGFYNYLLNLPDNWHFYKTQICKDCAIGIKKLDKYLKELKALGLVDFGQVRDAQGKFAHFYLDIYDRETITNTNEINDLQSVQPEGQNCRTVKAVRRFGEAIQNTYTQNTKNIKNNLSASSDAHAKSRFDDYWKVAPVKKNKKRAKEIWDKQKLDSQADRIIAHVKRSIREDSQWQDKQFIPHPDTYLRGEQWNDEITPITQSKPDQEIRRNEPRCTVPNDENDPYLLMTEDQKDVWYEQTFGKKRRPDTHGSEISGSNSG